MKRLWADANALLRFLTGEPRALADKAARLMASAELGEVVIVVSPLQARGRFFCQIASRIRP